MSFYISKLRIITTTLSFEIELPFLSGPVAELN